MGSAVWLYMWLIDKVMAINENGIGKVLNGRPVTHDDIFHALGIRRRTYGRWDEQVEKASDINTIRTPCGLTFTVKKASKMWGQKASENNAELFQDERYAKSDTSKVFKKKRPSDKNGASPATKMAHQCDKN